MTTTTDTLDLTALAAAITGRDAAGQLAAYRPDAELTVIDHEHPPTRPQVLRGAQAIGGHLADVCSREMTHDVRTLVVADNTLTLEVACRYADGTNVACVSIAGLEDGRIAWQRLVQAWDH
jgi:SnoaL-like domain